MLVITGTGRCGTTLIAEFCTRMGYETGGNLPEGETEGREDGKVKSLNHNINVLDLITTLTKGQNLPEDVKDKIVNIQKTIDTNRNISDKIKKVDNEVVKDPAFFNRHESCLDNWIQNKENLRFLIMIRDLDSSYNSAKTKGYVNFLWDDKNISLEDWKKKVYKTHFEFIKKLIENNIPFKHLKFPDITDNYKEVYKTLTELGLNIDYNKGEEVWNKLVNKKLIHF